METSLFWTIPLPRHYAQVCGSLLSPVCPGRFICAHSSSCANDCHCREPQIIPHFVFHKVFADACVQQSSSSVLSTYTLSPCQSPHTRGQEFLKALRQMRSHIIISIYCDKRNVSRQQKTLPRALVQKSVSTEELWFQISTSRNHWDLKS